VVLTTIAGLFGERHGDGAPRVLALHGWGRDHSDFTGVLRGIPSIAPDLPGFGATPPPTVATGSAGYAELVSPVLEEFDAPPIVVGHSFGGRIALQLAVRGLVESVVLVGTPLLKIGPRRRTPLGYRLMKRFRLVVGEDRLGRARRRYGSADYRAATGVMRDILVTVVNESYEALLSEVTCPARLVWGEQDIEVPVAVARAAVDRLPDGRLRVIPGVGHLVPLAAPEIVRAELLELM
jgi:pimeloyl-ACP methyl ester carboxylesterase